MEHKKELVITRVFDASRERVWKACTEEADLRKWFGQPKEGNMPYSKLDFRVGGSFHFKVELPDGVVVWGKSIYKEIVTEERLVLLDYYSNEEGDLTDTPELPRSLITLLFESEGEKTKLTVRHEHIGIGIHTIAQYTEGWNGSLDRLAHAVNN
jgi:uncharacterized protein YndB with AHSA1/START domain